ncbi:flagellar export chaperone FliS [Pseudalkalibacillus caeni]|uniref:Flagellar secretion chaperone FliS n=1 Tax=Exobacillus caeni TaxID=2574798 RepID=A0A5R9EZG5_9BACL|nr:flagellar export chaperone FliS [Pseudalkalibacillus caeni]TLS36617.1 flagellar export chaperone FliS [Pseudalkalibacillus caeni]
MALKNPYQTYQQNAVNTASPQELTLMLYNGCLKFIKLSKKAMEEKNIEEKNTNILKAQAIVQEFIATLNMEIEVSAGMKQLYEYIYNRLVEANIKNDQEILTEVEGYITEFRDTWKQAMEKSKNRK